MGIIIFLGIFTAVNATIKYLPATKPHLNRGSTLVTNLSSADRVGALGIGHGALVNFSVSMPHAPYPMP
jgi:hypothetical protein